MNKAELGDVFKIKTRKGVGYLQYIKENDVLGELIRVFPEIQGDRLKSVQGIIDSDELFLVHFSLKTALKKKIVMKLGNFSTPSNFSAPKYMRTSHNVRGENLGWHIVDTQTWKRELVNELTASQIRMSPWGVWNDTLLIDRLSEGWTLDQWV